MRRAVPHRHTGQGPLAVTAIGPVEPGEGTHALPPPAPGTPRKPCDRLVNHPRYAALHGRLAAFRNRFAALRPRHRRAAVSGAVALALLAGGGYLYATRPLPQAPPPPPYPSQVVDLRYLGRAAPNTGGGPRTFGFEVLLGVTSGPPVTVTRIGQPFAGLSLTSVPRTPFRTRARSSRKIVITMRVTECGKVPMNSGLPFLDATLRNARVMQVHSFILGPRYARHLSEALQVACSNSSV